MQKKQIFVLLIVFAFLNVASVTLLLYVKADNNNFVFDGEPVFHRETNPRELEGISGTPRFAGMVWSGMGFDDGNGWEVGVIDDYMGGFYNLTFEKIVTGTHGNIWVGLSPDVWAGDDPGEEYQDYFDEKDPLDPLDDTWNFAYPWSWQGMPNNYSDLSQGYYLYPDYYDWVTREQLEYMMDEFDNNIHEKVTTHFGMYADRPGPLNDYKVQILIFNIRDGLFWEPETAPWFIMGYFWSFASNENNANIFHMDCYQWWRRAGDNPVCPPPYQDLSPKPNQYEGTFAHEFQHLVHNDVDPDEYPWVDEGCATLAEWLCGYGFSPGHISEYLINFWNTPLTAWGDTLADYGASFLWTFYMYEHYGGASIIWDLVHEQENGIAGWNAVIKKYAKWKDFDDIFQDWAIANYLDDPSFRGGKYGYYALDLPSADSDGYDIPYVMFLWDYFNPGAFNWFVSSYPHEGYDYPYGASQPYVVNYVEFHPGEKSLIKVEFDGDDNSGIPAYSGTYEWHSGGEAWSWFTLGQSFTVDDPTATLTFWTYYEIETDWDYGYVEVYDHDLGQWFTLASANTTDTLPWAQDNPYTPDEREPFMYYYVYDDWNALTGFSGGWYQESMDLSMFLGHTIDLYFTYWSDGLYQELGWYVDDIEVTGVTAPLFDDVESGEGNWNVNYGWQITDGLIEHDFKVSFVEVFNFYNRHGELRRTFNHVSHMRINDEDETGKKYLSLLDRKRVKTWALMVVANQPGYEHTFAAGYTFKADRPKFCKWW